jgi:hypothetical protein
MISTPKFDTPFPLSLASRFYGGFLLLKTIPLIVSLVTFVVTGFGNILLLARLFRGICLFGFLGVYEGTKGWLRVSIMRIDSRTAVTLESAFWTGLEMSFFQEESLGERRWFVTLKRSCL